MAERLPVVDKLKLNYEGLFEAKEVYAVVKAWASDKGYWLYERHHTESIKPEGKYIDMDVEAFKKITDYAKSVVQMRCQFHNVKDVIVERDGKKHKMQEGKILITFNGVLETDYEHKWETKPVFYFLRTVFQKYVYSPFISGFERGIKEDTLTLNNQVKAFLNLTKFQ